MPTESEIIAKVRSRAPAIERLIVGIGDDAAVIRMGDVDLIACCDMVVEGIHFRAEWATPRQIGYKALAATISDVAAMGGTPRFAMVSMACGRDQTDEFVDGLIEGLFEAAESHGVAIIGGDTSSSPGPLFIDTALIGECPAGKAIRRSGALVGDLILITGSLGASALGLRLFESGHRLESIEDGSRLSLAKREAMLRHLRPQPRVGAGRAISESGMATAMIDISDGLSTDLWHILRESRLGAIICAESIPVAECVLSMAAADPRLDPLDLALNSGEEYELIFTIRPEHLQQACQLLASFGLPVAEIGRIVSTPGLKLERGGQLLDLKPSGYEHFSG
jgi:thiamine-monophosphate kinase